MSPARRISSESYWTNIKDILTPAEAVRLARETLVQMLAHRLGYPAARIGLAPGLVALTA